ncbi:MAG: glycosyltransferase [Acidimicrobiales bacterium]
MSSPSHTLVIPMFNEADRISATLQTIAASRQLCDGLELLLVNDGSTDATASAARQALVDFGLPGRLIDGPHMGKGAAVMTGLAAGTAPVRAFVDADLSTDLPSIQRVLAAVQPGQVDVAIASRRHRESDIRRHQPPQREMAGRAFNLILRGLGLTRHRDTQCGLKAFTADAIEVCSPKMTSFGFAFDVELLFIAEREGFASLAFPVTWSDVEGSSVKMWTGAPAMLRELLRLRRLYRSTAPPLSNAR